MIAREVMFNSQTRFHMNLTLSGQFLSVRRSYLIRTCVFQSFETRKTVGKNRLIIRTSARAIILVEDIYTFTFSTTHLAFHII